jgi:hypothetical protein
MFCCVVVVSNCGTAWWPFTVPCLRTQPSHRFHGLPTSTWRFLHMWQTWLTYKFCYNLCHNLCQLHGGVKMDTNDSFTWKKTSPLSYIFIVASIIRTSGMGRHGARLPTSKWPSRSPERQLCGI